MPILDNEDDSKLLEVSNVCNEFVEILTQMVELQQRFGGSTSKNVEEICKFLR